MVMRGEPGVRYLKNPHKSSLGSWLEKEVSENG